MGFDLLGQLLGKARRRELEGQVALNAASIGKRLGVGIAAAGLAVKADPNLLLTKNGQISLTAIGLVAMIPAGAAAAGILTSAEPGKPSIGEALVQTAVNLVTAPADKRQAAQAAADAKIVAAVQAGLREAVPEMVDLAAEKVRSQTGSFQSNGAGQGLTEIPIAKEIPITIAKTAAQALFDGLDDSSAVKPGATPVLGAQTAIVGTSLNVGTSLIVPASAATSLTGENQ